MPRAKREPADDAPSPSSSGLAGPQARCSPQHKRWGYETVWKEPAPPGPNVASLHSFLLSSLEEWLLLAEVVVLPSKFTTQGGAFWQVFLTTQGSNPDTTLASQEVEILS